MEPRPGVDRGRLLPRRGTEGWPQPCPRRERLRFLGDRLSVWSE